MTSRSARLPARIGLPVLLLLLLSACAPLGRTPGAANAFTLPSTTKGVLAFTPVDGATELDPSQTEVIVRAVGSGASLKSVTVTPDGGQALAGTMRSGEFHLDHAFLTDTHYSVVALATTKDSSGTSSEVTETSSFSTATTPKVLSMNPQNIGDGQSVVVALTPSASAVSINGPVKYQLSPDGTQVTIVPESFKQGQKYDFTLVAKNRKGIAGTPQALSFTTLPAATVDILPNPGSQNVGVGMPLTMALSSDVGDKNDLAGRISVTADVHAAPAASPGTGVCAGYTSPTVASGPIDVSLNWITSKRVRIAPKTPDGYWPADSTINLSAKLSGYHTSGGSFFEHDVTMSFNTGDKRVIDVDLSAQQLTACKNGTQANQFLISSGVPSHLTYTGHFYIYSRVQDEEMKSPEGPFAPDFYDIKHVPWTQYFDGGAALHGAWWHNNFGHPMSHGCVNVQTPTDNTRWPNATPQAEWLWNFDALGDPVIVHGVTPGLSPSQQLSD